MSTDPLKRLADFAAWRETLNESDRGILARHVPVDCTERLCIVNEHMHCAAHGLVTWPCVVVRELLESYGRSVADLLAYASRPQGGPVPPGPYYVGEKS